MGVTALEITTIFFDFGNTLVATTSTVEFWGRVMEELDLIVDPRHLEAAIREADRAFVPAYYDYRGQMPAFWERYDRGVLNRLGLADRLREVRERIEAGFDTGRWHRPYPETREVLDSLRAMDYGLGVISNNTDDIHRTLAAHNLAQYFDHVTYSQEARAEKPDPAVFRLALQRALCDPTEAIHVGDVYEADVVGARSVGMFPVLVDRNDRRPDTDCHRIRDLRELFPFLEARNF